MKNINKIKRSFRALCLVAVAAAGSVSCQSYLDRSPESEYLNTDFYSNEGAIKQGTTAIYSRLKMDWSSTSNIPYSTLWDMYTPFGIERADNASTGVGNVNLENNFTQEQIWAITYTSIARANNLLDGVQPHLSKLNTRSLQYIAEVKVLRAHFYLQLVQLFGDVPFFTSQVTEEELRGALRKPWREIIDFLLADLEEAASALPWVNSTDWGRVDRSVALGLKARAALYAASWCKFGYGMSGVKDAAAATNYFKISADAAKRVIDESGRVLSPKFGDLFTRSGQLKPGAKSENMLFMMFSDQGAMSTHYVSAGEMCRMIGQSGRFPTQMFVDQYETKNGLRIDQDPTYDPKKPFENRDPRLRETVYAHGDTIIGSPNGVTKMKFLMNVYGPTVKAWDMEGNETTLSNVDYIGSVAQYGYVQSGVGFLWKKYNYFDDEGVFIPSYNIVIMRYAEILLTYAEAKIELNEIDAIVVDAINQVRARVGMPAILPGDQQTMRQRVRRERKVEFGREALFFLDMRRWRIGDLLNAEPTYGYPLATGVDAAKGIYPVGYDQVTPDMVPDFGAKGSPQELNDVPRYAKYASKLRSRDKDRKWQDKFYVWPIPQTERNKCPWLTQNEGYGQ